MRTEIREAVGKLVAAHTPTAKTNIGRSAATYAVLHTIAADVETIMDGMKPMLRDAAMFDDGKKVDIYRNKVFAVTATRTSGRRTLDRNMLIVALCKRFDIGVIEATKFLDDNAYKSGEPSVSLGVEVV